MRPPASRRKLSLGLPPKRCKVVRNAKKVNSTRSRRAKASMVMRASVSLPDGVYRELERIADARKVSFAWIVREAAEQYLERQWPLLAGTTTDK